MEHFITKIRIDELRHLSNIVISLNHYREKWFGENVVTVGA